VTITYYRTPEGYVGLTDESPRGFKGVIFVGRGPKGGGPETVCEQGYVPGTGWEQVDASEVPDEWIEALGYEQRPLQPEPDRMRMEILFPWEEPSKPRITIAFWASLLAMSLCLLWQILT
jgi:hypothetical protein